MTTINILNNRKILKKSIYEFLVHILRLMLPFLRLLWDVLLRFYIPKEKKTWKSGILEILPSWYILSLKLKGKCDCKNFIHFSSVSYIFIF